MSVSLSACLVSPSARFSVFLATRLSVGLSARLLFCISVYIVSLFVRYLILNIFIHSFCICICPVSQSSYTVSLSVQYLSIYPFSLSVCPSLFLYLCLSDLSVCLPSLSAHALYLSIYPISLCLPVWMHHNDDVSRVLDIATCRQLHSPCALFALLLPNHAVKGKTKRKQIV